MRVAGIKSLLDCQQFTTVCPDVKKIKNESVIYMYIPNIDLTNRQTRPKKSDISLTPL